MPVINEGQLQTGSLKGARHGATISLILDHSEPGQGPRLHRHPLSDSERRLSIDWLDRTIDAL
jgi:hypothetical protein